MFVTEVKGWDCRPMWASGTDRDMEGRRDDMDVSAVERGCAAPAVRPRQWQETEMLSRHPQEAVECYWNGHCVRGDMFHLSSEGLFVVLFV